MAAYYKVDVVLNSQAVSVGLPSPQSVSVTLPLVGPQGPAGPQGEQGPPGEVSGTIVWDNVTEKPTTFPPSSHTHVAADITDFTAAVEAVSPAADWNTLANKPSTFTPSLHGSSHHTGGTDAISPNNIGAASLQTTQALGSISTNIQLSAARNKRYTALNFSGQTLDINMPTTGHLVGDIVVVVLVTGGQLRLTRNGQTFGTLPNLAQSGSSYTFIASGTSAADWEYVAVDTHTHTASAITDFNTAAAAAAPVASVAGRTGAITLAVADVANAVADTDARLSDSRTPTSHAASHAAAGSDPVFDQDLNTTDGPTFLNLTVTGTIEANGATLNNFNFNNFVGIRELGQEFAGTLRVENDSLTANRTYDLPDQSGTIAVTSDIVAPPDPSTATPQALGTASAGTSDDYSRGDHVHAAPALNDLSNVSAATPSDNDVLVFDTATSTWVAAAPSGGGGASLMQSIAVGFVLN
jgi:hypothetical protein